MNEKTNYFKVTPTLVLHARIINDRLFSLKLAFVSFSLSLREMTTIIYLNKMNLICAHNRKEMSKVTFIDRHALKWLLIEFLLISFAIRRRNFMFTETV